MGFPWQRTREAAKRRNLTVRLMRAACDWGPTKAAVTRPSPCRACHRISAVSQVATGTRSVTVSVRPATDVAVRRTPSGNLPAFSTPPTMPLTTSQPCRRRSSSGHCSRRRARDSCISSARAATEARGSVRRSTRRKEARRKAETEGASCRRRSSLKPRTLRPVCALHMLTSVSAAGRDRYGAMRPASTSAPARCTGARPSSCSSSLASAGRPPRARKWRIASSRCEDVHSSGRSTMQGSLGSPLSSTGGSSGSTVTVPPPVAPRDLLLASAKRREERCSHSLEEEGQPRKRTSRLSACRGRPASASLTSITIDCENGKWGCGGVG